MNEETRLKLHELINKAEENDETSHSSWAIIGQHSVSDKTISDAVEALVGVYLQVMLLLFLFLELLFVAATVNIFLFYS